MVDRKTIETRQCIRCKCAVARVVESDDLVWVEGYAGRRSDPIKALRSGKIPAVDSTSRSLWHRMVEPADVTCARGHKQTISPALEIEKATGEKPRPIDKPDQTELANGIAHALAFVHAHPEVLANDPNYSPPPLDYSALTKATEQVASAAPTGVYLIS